MYLKLSQNLWVKPRWAKLLKGLLLALLTGVATFATAEGGPIPANNIAYEPSISEKIRLLDLDILVLKAELARKKAQPDQVSAYLQEISKLQLTSAVSEDLEGRLASLSEYVMEHAQSSEAVQGQGVFEFNPSKMVVLLPLSGQYAKAGESLLAGIKQTLTNKGLLQSNELYVFDTQMYDSMASLWELVQLYEPSFIFGPLEKENVAQLYQLNTQVPTLALNLPKLDHVEKIEQASFKMLAPNPKDQVEYLVEMIIQNGFSKVGLLFDHSVQSQQLKYYFDQAWLLKQAQVASLDEGEWVPPKKPHKQNEPFVQIETIQVDDSLDRGVHKLVGANKSEKRAGWLGRTLERKLVSQVRPRNDFDVVVSLLPSREAMQVSPLLSYFALSRVLHFWLPSELPPVDKFASAVGAWQPTLMILPDYFSRKLGQLNPNVIKQPLQETAKISEESKVGTFYALGELAVEAVTRLTDENQQKVDTVLGILSVKKGNFHLYPTAYWLDEGVLEAVK